MQYLFYCFVLFYPFAFMNYTKFKIGSTELGFDDIILIILVLLYFIKYLIKLVKKAQLKIYRIPKGVLLLMLAFIFYSINVFFVTIIDDRPIVRWVQTTGFVFVFFVTFWTIRNERILTKTIILYKISTLILAISAIISAYGLVGTDLFYYKIAYRSYLGSKYASTGLVESRGGFGINIAFVLPFAFQSVLKIFFKNENYNKKHFLRILINIINIIYFLILIWAIIISGSRSTWLMGIVVLSSYFFLEFKRFIKKIYLKAIIYLMIIFVILISIPYFINIVVSVYNISSLSADRRFEMNDVALKVLFESPLIGQSYSQIFSLTTKNVIIHNYFLDVAAQSGIIGLFPMLYIFYKTLLILRWCWNNRLVNKSKEEICLICGFFGMIISLNFYPGGDKQIYSYIGIIAAFFTLQYVKKREIN